jgi:hypothetical protein
MNRGKAPDISGISAEHIQYGGKSVAKYILATFREMIRTKIVPEEIKEGLLTPFFMYGFLNKTYFWDTY